MEPITHAVTRARILIVEEPQTGRLLERMLAWHGHECRLAEDVAAAWDELADGGVDVILCGTAVDRGAGIDLLRRLAGASGAPAVVALAARGDAAAAEAAFEIGVDAFVAKPFEWTDVLIPVAAALRRRPATPALRLVA